MVAQADIENLQSRLHALRGALWRERGLTTQRANDVRRQAHLLMRQGCTPSDTAALQSLLSLTDCLREGLNHPA